MDIGNGIMMETVVSITCLVTLLTWQSFKATPTLYLWVQGMGGVKMTINALHGYIELLANCLQFRERSNYCVLSIFRVALQLGWTVCGIGLLIQTVLPEAGGGWYQQCMV